jgi:hypothetical protein
MRKHLSLLAPFARPLAGAAISRCPDQKGRTKASLGFFLTGVNDKAGDESSVRRKRQVNLM